MRVKLSVRNFLLLYVASSIIIDVLLFTSGYWIGKSSVVPEPTIIVPGDIKWQPLPDVPSPIINHIEKESVKEPTDLELLGTDIKFAEIMPTVPKHRK